MRQKFGVPGGGSYIYSYSYIDTIEHLTLFEKNEKIYVYVIFKKIRAFPQTEDHAEWYYVLGGLE